MSELVLLVSVVVGRLAIYLDEPSNFTTSPLAMKRSSNFDRAMLTVVFSICASAIWLAAVRFQMRS